MMMDNSRNLEDSTPLDYLRGPEDFSNSPFIIVYLSIILPIH